jgi:hypothetical protein
VKEMEESLNEFDSILSSIDEFELQISEFENKLNLPSDLKEEEVKTIKTVDDDVELPIVTEEQKKEIISNDEQL